MGKMAESPGKLSAFSRLNRKLEPIKLYDGSLGANESTTLSHHITDFNKIMFEVTVGGSIIIAIPIIVDNRSSITTAYYITDTMFVHISIDDTIIRLGAATHTNMRLTKIFAYLK